MIHKGTIDSVECYPYALSSADIRFAYELETVKREVRAFKQWVTVRFVERFGIVLDLEK